MQSLKTRSCVALSFSLGETWHHPLLITCLLSCRRSWVICGSQSPAQKPHRCGKLSMCGASRTVSLHPAWLLGLCCYLGSRISLPAAMSQLLTFSSTSWSSPWSSSYIFLLLFSSIPRLLVLAHLFLGSGCLPVDLIISPSSPAVCCWITQEKEDTELCWREVVPAR